MPFAIRKVRNAEKYRLTIKDDEGSIVLTEIFDNREGALQEGALQKVRDQMDKIVEDEKQQDLIINNDVPEPDTEIEDV